MDLKNFFKGLQNRPYEQRVRLLWLATTACGVILLLLWAPFLKLNNTFPAAQNNELISSLKQGLSETQEQLNKLGQEAKSQLALGEVPPDFQPVTIKDFTFQEEAGLLIIFLQITNPTLDILNFLNVDRANIQLIDQDQNLLPQKILLDNQELFPNRILSKTELTGQLTFPRPKSNEVTLRITKMFFENTPNNLFNQELKLVLDGGVKGTKSLKLPRE